MGRTELRCAQQVSGQGLTFRSFQTASLPVAENEIPEKEQLVDHFRPCIALSTTPLLLEIPKNSVSFIYVDRSFRGFSIADSGLCASASTTKLQYSIREDASWDLSDRQLLS